MRLSRTKKLLLSAVSVFITMLCFSESEIRFLKPEYTKDLAVGETAIIIRTNVRKTSVFLNGEFQGLTPLTIKNLVPGQYRLAVQDTKGNRQLFLIEVKRSLSEYYYIELDRPATRFAPEQVPGQQLPDVSADRQ